MMPTVRRIPVAEVKSKWFTDLITQWSPEKGYIEYLQGEIIRKRYVPPIVVVQEEGVYYIVNGHHRYYAHVAAGEKEIRCIIIGGTFADSEPLRKAEVLLKEFDQKTEYRYQFSGYLDRWAAAAEGQKFINRYRPTYKFRLYRWLKKKIRS